MWLQTAVMRRNEIVTMRRSIIGIMLISESRDLLPPLPPLSTLTPPMLAPELAPERLPYDLLTLC
jgi:hypothetical protein